MKRQRNVVAAGSINQIAKESPKQRQRAREEKLRLLAAQLGLNAPDTNGKNWDLEEEEGGPVPKMV